MPRKQIPLWFIFLAWALMFYQGLMASEKFQYKGQAIDIPTRKVSVILSDGGYYPDVIQAFEGEKLEFIFTTTLQEPGCMVMPDKNLFIGARSGELGKGELVLRKPETFFFYCPSNQYQGKIVVMKRPKRDEEDQQRSIASQKPKEWYPKD